jgi:hypothetical protein
MRIRHWFAGPGALTMVMVLLTSCGQGPTQSVEGNGDDPIPTPLQPEMTIAEPSFDFGYCPQNSKVSHVFWLHSTGTDTLNIVQVKPG